MGMGNLEMEFFHLDGWYGITVRLGHGVGAYVKP